MHRALFITFLVAGAALITVLVILLCQTVEKSKFVQPVTLVTLPPTSNMNDWLKAVRLYENKSSVPVIKVDSMSFTDMKKKIKVLQHGTVNALTRQYCDKFDYDYQAIDVEQRLTTCEVWLFLFHLLKSSSADDYFCLILNPDTVLHPDSNKPLQRLIDQSGDSSLIVCRDGNNKSLFSLDMFLFRNTEWSQFKCLQLYLSSASNFQQVLQDQVYSSYKKKSLNTVFFDLGLPRMLLCTTVYHEKAFDLSDSSDSSPSVYPWSDISGFVEIPNLVLPRSHTVNKAEQLIPKIIYQTMNTTLANKDRYRYSTEEWVRLNPDYTYRFFDAKDCREFIEKHFDKRVVKAYNMLLCGAYQADFWRMCVLYVHGGCYADSQTQPLVPLNEIIEADTEFVSANDSDLHGLWQGFLCAVPNHSALWTAIQTSVHNILRRKHFKSYFSLTGPNLLRKSLNQYLNRPKKLSLITYPPPRSVKLVSFVKEGRPFLTMNSINIMLSKYYLNNPKKLSRPHFNIYDISGKEYYANAHDHKRIFTFPLLF
jgi:mannosyltransferase OCH1-like enzyme